MVQEAFLRWTESNVEPRSAKDFLSTVVTRLCIDYLRSARVRRESYVGPWLPEPLLVDDQHDPGELVLLNESLSTAFLVMLESLAPVERAVFLLRQVFDYDYADIARVVEKSEANCRQLMRRARQRIAEGKQRFHADPAAVANLTRQFLEACGTGDLESLVALLADDVTVWVDGGGQVSAARNPVIGADAAARYFLGLVRKAVSVSVQVRGTGGGPAIITYAGGQPFGVLTFDLHEGRIRNLYLVVNPGKLKHVSVLQ